MDWLDEELATVPAVLRNPIAERIDEVLAADPGLAALVRAEKPVRRSLIRVLSLSRFAARTLCTRPGLLAAMLERGFGQPTLADRLQYYLAEHPANPAIALRRWRQEMMLGVIWQDLNALCDLDQVLETLSECGDVALRAACRIASQELAEPHGESMDVDGHPQELVILAMGKLGGSELNLSSDIDLIFLYPSAGSTNGRRPLDNQQYFQRLGQRIISLLDETTEQGRVYRVDMRLRPFGDAGPLVMSFNALESYLQENGRDWERYAYIKARAVTDAAAAESLFNDVLRPFVYRRYLDYGVFDALREMREMIAREMERRDLVDNIKLGPGGIREIEFIAQCLQLVRGGSQPALRRRSLLEALSVLHQHRLLPESATDELSRAYRFLRNLENRLQAADDRQTHKLPGDEESRAALASAMDMQNWDTLVDALRAHAVNVSRWFEELIPVPPRDEIDNDRKDFSGIWDGSLSSAAATELFRRLDCDEPEKVYEELRRFAGASLFRRLDQPGVERLRQLLPSIVRLTAPKPDAAQILRRVFDVLEAVGRRSSYFVMLNENPAALERLVGLCGSSGFLTSQIAVAPILLDDLLDPNLLNAVPERSQFVAELDNRLLAAEADAEQQHAALRRFQSSAVFRVALADLDKRLPLMKVSDRLTDIAELVIGRSLRIAWQGVLSRHEGPSATTGNSTPGFLILGYGKLGGLEMGYGSDLDLVFLYDTEMAWPKKKEGDGEVFYGRLGRRLVNFLAMQTPAGRLYEVDMRLRPSGNAGLLVSSIRAFGQYQKQEAWTWEHQALLRARPVAGDLRLARQFESLRQEVLTQHVRREGLAEQVASMRQKMRSEISRSGDGQFDIKQDTGGVADIEFLVQFLVLKKARRYPGLLTYSDNMRQLEALAECGVLDAEQTRLLMEAYVAYRQRLHHLSLEFSGSTVDDDEFFEESSAVKTLWTEMIRD